MSVNFQWLASPPSMALAALGLVFLSPVGNSPEISDASSPCHPAGNRIAVAALDASRDTEISVLAGRAPYYLVFESSALLEIVTNQYAEADRGAGQRAAYRLSDLGIDCLVAGEVGPRMSSVLAAEGIAFSPASGEAAAVILEALELGGAEGF